MDFQRYFDEISAGLDHLGVNAVVVRQVDSTNRLARAVVDEYRSAEVAVPPIFIVAWEQLAGRGRFGRTWVSPAGAGVYASAVLPIPEPEGSTLVPLAVGVALANGLNHYLDGRCRLKWPNDLVVDGRKLGGILIEGSSRGGGPTELIAGLGVNLTELAGDQGLSAATSMEREAAVPPTLVRLTLDLLQEVSEVPELSETPADVVERYRSLSCHEVGSLLRWRDGEGTVAGRFLGIDDQGFLHLETSAGDELVASAGEVDEA